MLLATKQSFADTSAVFAMYVLKHWKQKTQSLDDHYTQENQNIRHALQVFLFPRRSQEMGIYS